MMMMMTASLRRLGGATSSLTAGRDVAMRLVVRASPRSTTTADVAGLTEEQHHAAGAAGKDRRNRCPLTPAGHETQPSTVDIKPMRQLDGPVGWPIVGSVRCV